ncbi:MAG TPA: hypothetical protein VFW87_06560, partial [Pirellulales bacterium]|nr:hypothetical protein [Pirellulales bacterium]
MAAMVALANLSFEHASKSPFVLKSFGWPFIWHRYVTLFDAGWPVRTIGWYFSLGRFAANLMIWLAILIGSAAACEWLIRCYRPRWRFGLREMFAAVGLIALFFGWFAAARNRANYQDQIIDEIGAYRTIVDRSGPRWLDLFGVDRYRRQIVAITGPVLERPVWNEAAQKRMKRLSELSSLRYIEFLIDQLSPEAVAALTEMRQLTSLKLELLSNPGAGDDERRSQRQKLPPIGELTRLEQLTLDDISIDDNSLAGLNNLKFLHFSNWRSTAALHDSFAAIGELHQLEHLALSCRIPPEGLACLKNLVNLRTLTLHCADTGEPSWLTALPRLPRLEVLWVDYGIREHCVGNELRRVALLPRLKALKLDATNVTPAGIAELAPLVSLEELAVNRRVVSPAGIESLLAIKSLKKLAISPFPIGSKTGQVTLDDSVSLRVEASDFDDFYSALCTLRKARPDLIVNGFASGDFQQDLNYEFFGYRYNPDTDPVVHVKWLPSKDWPWMTPVERTEF